MTNHVTIFEMGPRDGLQNEKQQISTADKIKLVDLLSICGFSKIEVTSFVSPKWVPQMADAAQVLAGITRRDDISYAALTPNMRGYEGAKAANANEVAIFASASEGFSQKNINCSIAQSIERFKPLLEAATSDNIPVRGYVSCITDCPYDGPTPPNAVADVVAQLLELGCYEVSLGDTIGAATPKTTQKMLDAVLSVAQGGTLAGHFHDTKGRALDNIETCLSSGIRTFDTAVGGLGGCPYAPGAKGNVATEAVVQMLSGKGFATNIDLDKLMVASRFATSLKG